MTIQNSYYFTLHDSGGRVVERFRCMAENYTVAYVAADERARKICSHGITRCDTYWRPAWSPGSPA